jgi:hypothetical protein
MKDLTKLIKTKIREFINENINQDEVKNKILNGTDFDDWIEAVRIQYGNVVPLYHATTKDISKIIDNEGFKLTHGKNYKSFTHEPIMYFQIGKSDYVSSNRPILYRLDVPIDFLYNTDIDMDNPDISDEEISRYVDMEDWDDLPYEIKDAITYFIWNNFKLEGTELLISDRYLQDTNENIFKGLKPIKIVD